MSTLTTNTKNLNCISGKVILKENNKGISNLLVVLLDMDPGARNDEPFSTAMTTTAAVPALRPAGDRIGSVITGADGTWSMYFDDDAFRVLNESEKRPDLLLMILAPEEPGMDPFVLFQSTKVRVNAGKFESYLVKLSKEQLERAGVPIPDDNPESTENKIETYRRENEKRIRLQQGISEINKSVLVKEIEEKKAFVKSFVSKISTDFSVVPLTGELVSDGEDIRQKNIAVANKSISKASSVITSGKGVPVNLFLSPSDQDRLTGFFLPQNLVDGKAVIPEEMIREILFRTNSSENPGTLLVHNNPIVKFCLEHTSDEVCAKIHTNIIQDEEEIIDSHGHHSSNGNGTTTAGANDVIAGADISKYIARVVTSLPSPDSVLKTEAHSRADKKIVEKNIHDFSLEMGPADLPAFYDFHVLQIAFEHIWKQLLDSEIIEGGHRVNELFKTTYGINWLAYLEASGLNFTNATQTPAPLEVPAVVSSFFDVTRDEYNDLSQEQRSKLVHIATTLEAMVYQLPVLKYNDHKFIQEFREQGERLLDSIRHDDYYSLHKTLRDLQERLKSTYEFTVFAADKNFHSINFGVLNTYRQKWTPLNYQAGKLVKTIPLSPKEERKYNLKISRNQKRSVKEARKNNSSVAAEQSSVSRVESEIVEKALNKTNFSLSAEGDYDIFISSGKSTTSFGVEAQSESAQSRKDFRESILKATQEYKEEVSVEVNTEETSAYEFSESGTIVNPNDEIAVTYLFYELQRRYRISEQLYRVMPVVLVAQEVPSPDEITEAWVIAHDWIINRCLLDDSFRPALEYLATKSVGDDFALRELRKNLRQQRNLVDTLRLEFSIASEEASNRYRSLERQIENRIQAEIDEDNEGFFTNVAAFFGHNDANPEAAKAREMAAKDAHQYAVEKAEKAGAALRQEVAHLQTITNEYNKTLRNHLDCETKVKRLLVHIRNNVLYYMQNIWMMEPPDQRFLRLHKVQVPVLELDEMEFPANSGNTSKKFYFIDPEPVEDIFQDFREKELNDDGTVKRFTVKHKAFLQGRLKPLAEAETPFKALVEVADLDSLLGFKGNYMIFPMKEHNALTEFMAAPYVDNAFGAMDPDELSNVNLNDYSRYICCLHDHLSPADFEKLKPQLKEWLKQLLADPLRNGDEITVPTNSLFIEALPAKETLLENFKLYHRKLDVYKVQSEVRKAELENLRYAARLLQEEMDDPDIEKKVVVDGNITDINVDVDN